MKPYCKTFRARKDHKASECGICSEDTEGGANHERQQAKQEIRAGELDCEDGLQAQHNEDEGWHEFDEHYEWDGEA